MADSWTESRKRRKSRGYIILGVGLAAVALIFLQNNYGIFTSLIDHSQKDTVFSLAADSAVGPHPAAEVPAAKAPAGQQPVAAVVARPPAAAESQPQALSAPRPAEPAPLTKPQEQTTAPAAARDTGAPLPVAMQSISITNIRCRLADAQRQEIVVSLRLRFHSRAIEDEVLLKRDEIRVIVQKVFSQKFLQEIQINALRTELKRSVNGLLDNKGIDDVEFEDFRPMEM
jgi:flagellar basal body-associated protein FliL